MDPTFTNSILHKRGRASDIAHTEQCKIPKIATQFDSQPVFKGESTASFECQTLYSRKITSFNGDGLCVLDLISPTQAIQYIHSANRQDINDYTVIIEDQDISVEKRVLLSLSSRDQTEDACLSTTEFKQRAKLICVQFNAPNATEKNGFLFQALQKLQMNAGSHVNILMTDIDAKKFIASPDDTFKKTLVTIKRQHLHQNKLYNFSFHMVQTTTEQQSKKLFDELHHAIGVCCYVANPSNDQHQQATSSFNIGIHRTQPTWFQHESKVNFSGKPYFTITHLGAEYKIAISDNIGSEFLKWHQISIPHIMFYDRKLDVELHQNYHFLSNTYHALFLLDGKSWNSVEHYFQYQKIAQYITPALHADHLAKIYADLQQIQSGGEAKKYVKQVISNHHLQVDYAKWNHVKYNIMYIAVKSKFTQQKALGKQLVNTYPCLLVEFTDDTEWGSGIFHHKQPGVGQNITGNLIARVRNDLYITKQF